MHLLLGLDAVGAADNFLLLLVREGSELIHGVYVLRQRHTEPQRHFDPFRQIVVFHGKIPPFLWRSILSMGGFWGLIPLFEAKYKNEPVYTPLSVLFCPCFLEAKTV